MKCKCGTEFSGDVCPKCGREASMTEKKSIWDKLEVITDKKTMLSVGSLLVGIYCVLTGYILPTPLFFAGAVLFSPILRKKHPQKERVFSIIGSVILCLGVGLARLETAIVEEIEEEAAAETQYYEPTTNEERYGNW